MNIRLIHVLIALLVILVVVTLAMIVTQCAAGPNACKAQCHDQGLDQWFHDAHTDECRCFSRDPA